MAVHLKELTKEQKRKADMIAQLLDELRQEDVYPYVIDGGGGDGICFGSHPRSEAWDIGEIILSGNEKQRKKIRKCLYKPALSGNNTIDYLCP